MSMKYVNIVPAAVVSEIPHNILLKVSMKYVNIVPAAVVWDIPHNILLKVSLKLRTFKHEGFKSVYKSVYEIENFQT